MASNRLLALLGLLAVAGYQNRDKLAEMFNQARDRLGGPDTAGRPSSGSGDPAARGTDRLPGTGAPTSAGDVRGGISDLIDAFTGAGRGDKAKSWVESGPNSAVTSRDLEETLGADTLAQLSKRTGLSRDELLSRLEAVLPEAVDKMTPEGRLPSESDVARWAGI
jgi:uncharacterized protein YidB (DUF937 family)